MKGVIFNHLCDMVCEEFGLELWDTVLEKSGDDGIFVSSEAYPDERVESLLVALSGETGVDVPDLLRAFGEYAFPRFIDGNPDFVSPEMGLRIFLLTVDRVIHVEVKKLHPDANLPEFQYADNVADELTMFYRSPRKLCMLAEGLIMGAAKYFNEECSLVHDECMHKGADACRLCVQINPVNLQKSA